MTDHERGAYTPPTDAPLSFDARQPVRGARPVPITLIISVLVLAGLVAAIFVFYRSGVRQAGDAPQTVGAPVAGMKEAAPNEAQPVDPAAGLQIYRSDGAGGAEAVPPTFTPPPEEPQPRPAPTTPVVVAQAPAPPAQPALRPTLPAQAPAQPPQKAAPAPAPVAKAPEPKAPAPKAPPPKAPEPKTPPAPVPKAGGAVVQIGAVSSTALADKAWSEAVGIAGGAGKGKSVEKIERNGGTLYRTAVTGFASREDATAFCNRLKAAGKSCFVR